MEKESGGGGVENESGGWGEWRMRAGGGGVENESGDGGSRE